MKWCTEYESISFLVWNVTDFVLVLYVILKWPKLMSTSSSVVAQVESKTWNDNNIYKHINTQRNMK